jgi:hypothetical protein
VASQQEVRQVTGEIFGLSGLIILLVFVVLRALSAPLDHQKECGSL